MTLKTPQEHCPCTCLDDYTRRGLEDPHCFSCQAGAELVLDVRAELREALAVEFEEQAREGSSRLFRAADVARTFGGDALARPPAERRTLTEQQGNFVAVKIPMFVRTAPPSVASKPTIEARANGGPKVVECVCGRRRKVSEAQCWVCVDERLNATVSAVTEVMGGPEAFEELDQ